MVVGYRGGTGPPALVSKGLSARTPARAGLPESGQPSPSSAGGLLGWPGGLSPWYRQPEPAAGGRHCTEAAAQLASSSSAAVRPASAVRRRKPAMSSSSSS